MQMVTRNELALAQVSGGGTKGDTNSSTTTNNTVVIVSQGGNSTVPSIVAGDVSINA